MKDDKTKERFIELRAEGWSFEHIAKELQTSKQTLINWSKEFEITIANLKAIQLEALQEKYYLTKKAKIGLFGEQIEKVKAELGKRDLSKVGTDKLFDVLIKLHNALKDESVAIKFSNVGTITLDESLAGVYKSLNTWEA